MRLEVWLAFVLLEASLSVSPGPAVLLVLSQAMLRGTAQAIWTILGILAGNTLYFALSGAGVGALNAISGDFLAIVRWAGAAYLVGLGVREIRHGNDPSPMRIPSTGRSEGFSVGFMCQAANPKALVFFAALLPQFIDPTNSLPFQVAILTLTSISLEFMVLLVYALLASKLSRLAATTKFRRTTNIGAGFLLISTAIGMIVL